MNHFRQKLTSPLISICGAYIYITVIAVLLYITGFYRNTTFMKWGPPFDFMGKTVTSNITYYCLLLLYFTHQLVNNWVNEVTYPWIINCIQDPKSKSIVYSKKVSIIIINLFAIYSQLDVLLIIAGVMSQITFFAALTLANMISMSYINWQYVKKVDYSPLIGVHIEK